MDPERTFSVESNLHQLRPELIIQHVVDAEESHWAQVDLGIDSQDSLSWTTSSSSSPLPDTQHPGLLLLRHGTSVKKIHRYFSQLEFRKCCLHLAGRRTTSQSMRVVHASSSASVDDGSAKKVKASPTYVTHLEDKELRAFKHAYLCAAYPVLAAPDPPSPFSPSPVHPPSTSASPQRGTEVRKSSPYSMHDSGMEEAEDLAFIPSESICSHLQRAFQLTDDKFRDYRHLINKTYIRKSAQKSEVACELLAEELAGQLTVLENNCHPFYRPQDFVPPVGYDLWRKAEYSHITEMLGKFWHFSLPFPRHTQDLMAELHTIHDDYRLLLGKLLSYERDFHRQAEEEGGMLASPLSSASIRLLKEFGLRYGVGEQYRRVLYLDQITQDFSPSLCYLRHLLSILNSIADLLPPNRHALTMVKKEYDMLMSSLTRMGTQVSKALEQMKSLFPNNKPPGAVELLIGLLQRGRDLRTYLLADSLQKPPSLTVTLTEIIQGLFFQSYERCKTVIRTELRHSRDVHVCPRMLYALIMEIRQEVLDYRNNFQTVFSPYFDITVLAARALYSLLMKDVDTLCQQEILRDSAIDLRMLALIHRLNQLDNDWSAYLKPKEQMWRLSFQTHINQWGVALQLHIQDLVLETIAGDAFVTQQMQLPSDYSPPLSLSSSSCSPQTERSVSLTPSINSAFSSLASTSRQNSTSDSEPHRSRSSVHTPTHPTQLGNGERGKDFLSFADRRRQCASVPVLSERPAIVRVVSEVGMARRMTDYGLHAASAVEDLRNAGEENLMRMENTGGDGVGDASTQLLDEREGQSIMGSPMQKEPFLLDSVVQGEDVEQVGEEGGEVEDAGRDSDSSSDSDSAEGGFKFPPLADVTDVNVSDASLSYKEPSPAASSARRRSKVKVKVMSDKTGISGRSLQDEAGKGSARNSGAHPEDQGSIRKTVELGGKGGMVDVPVIGQGQGQRGRRSCPPPQQRQSNLCSVSERVSYTLNPDQDRGPRQVRTVSIGTVSMGAESDGPFLQSLQSTVSFPTPTLPPNRHVVIPVSGSTIDLLVLLQRTLGFGHSLCQAIFSPRLRAKWGGGGQDGGEDEGDVAAMKASLQSSQNSAHLNIVKALCQGIQVYADNMLCLDLCSMPKDIAKRVVGLSLVEHAVRQQSEHKIWGCRHQLQGQLICTPFYNRKASYLSDRYEPITQKMCVRINNVEACQHYLKWCEKQTKAAHLHCQECFSTPSPSTTSRPDTTEGAAKGDARSRTSTLTGEAPPPTGEPGSGGGDAHTGSGDGRGVKRQWLEQTSTHLMSVWTALCRLMAYRINLFLHDGLTFLLTLKSPEVSVATCLTPLTTFLRSHFDALSSWLYRRSFRRVIEFLWIYIVQDIEEEAGKLLLDKGRRLSPHLLLQTLMHLMKFMNNSEKGITRELLLSQADHVVSKLQLFTLSTLHLIALYLRLVDRYSEGEVMPEEDIPQRTIPITALHQLRRDLQNRRKCFSGAQLTHWILHHSDLFLSPDELSLCGGVTNISREGAMAIAQHLLDTQVILDVEASNAATRSLSSVLLEPQYPEVSLLGELHSSQNTSNYHDDSDEASTPTPQPQPVRQGGEHVHHSPTSCSTTPQDSQTAGAGNSVEQSVHADVTTSWSLPQSSDAVPKYVAQPSNSDATTMPQPYETDIDNSDSMAQPSDSSAVTVPLPSDVDRDDGRGSVPQSSDSNTVTLPQPSEAGTDDRAFMAQSVTVPQPSEVDTDDKVSMAQPVTVPQPSEVDTDDKVSMAQPVTVPQPSEVDTDDKVSMAQPVTVPQPSEVDTDDKVSMAQPVTVPQPSEVDTDDMVSMAQPVTVPQPSEVDTDDKVSMAQPVTVPQPSEVDTDDKVSMAQPVTVPQPSEVDTDDKVSAAQPSDWNTVTVPQLFDAGRDSAPGMRTEGNKAPPTSTYATTVTDGSMDDQTVATDGEQQMCPGEGHTRSEVAEKNQHRLTEVEEDHKLPTEDGPVTTVSDQAGDQTPVTSRAKELGSPESSTTGQLLSASSSSACDLGAVRSEEEGSTEKGSQESTSDVGCVTQAERTSGMIQQVDSKTGVVCRPGSQPESGAKLGGASASALNTSPDSGHSASDQDSGLAESQDVTEPVEGAGPSAQGAEQAEAELPPIMVTLSANLPSSAKASPSYCHSPLHVAREGSVYDLDMNSIMGTPVSFSFPFSSTTSLFDNSVDKFYFVPPSPTFPPQSQHYGTSLPSPLERSLEQLKRSEETSSLVEKCFLLKITPTSLLMVLHARRKADTLARSFLQQLPPAVQQQLSSGMAMRGAECSVL